MPPEGAGIGAPAVPGQQPTGVEGGAFTTIVRNGVPSLVVGTRLYTRGQKMGNATIERITETEVWLREGRVLRKVSQFSGIERRVASAPSSPSANSGGLGRSEKSATKTKKPASGCNRTATPIVSCDTKKP